MITRTFALLALTAIVSISACGRVVGEPIESVGERPSQGEDATGTAGSMGAGGTCGSTGSSGPTCGVIPPSGGPTVCPAQWTPEISDQLPCSMPNGTICHYQEPTGWRACACGCQDEFRFSCYGHTGWGDCPASQPTPGDACAYKAGCEYFPDTECDCNTSLGKWECHTEPLLTWECLDPASDVPPLSCIATDQHVKDLSDADMQAWCEWYMNAWPPGNKPASNFLDGNGYVIGGASRSRTDPFMCIEHLSVEYCKANLQISQCDATLGQVEDCVRTLWNHTLLVGHGCTPLQECGCESTIVQFAQFSSMALCAVPIQ